MTADKIAAFCKLNRIYFSRRFKAVMGCAPQEFLIRQRLTNAAELLRSTNLPIKTVANRCGYRDQPAFIRASPLWSGPVPSAW